jgi:LysM repeat protein
VNSQVIPYIYLACFPTVPPKVEIFRSEILYRETAEEIMANDSLNLVDLVQRYLPGDFAGKMSSLLGERRDKAQAGINASVPGLLAALGLVASTTDGARRLSSAVDDTDPGILTDIGGMLGKDSRSFMDRGSGILQSILGGTGLSDLSGRIAGSSGLSGRAVTSLLGFLAPLILGVLRKEKLSRGLDSLGLANLLASQRSNIAAAMPEGMLGRTERIREVGEGYKAPRTARTETYTTREPAKHSWLSWVLPLALLAGLLGLVWQLTSRPERRAAITDSTVHAEREPVRTDSTVDRTAALERLKTKYHSVIQEARAQGVKISSINLENGKLIVKGTAPSLAASTAVWNEIKRLNPRQDDIVADFTVDASMAPSSDTTMPPSAEPANSGMPATSNVPLDGGTHQGDETYTVMPGDTLGTISKEFYGNAGEYMRIFDANRNQLTDQDHIEVGQQLRIPQ